MKPAGTLTLLSPEAATARIAELKALNESAIRVLREIAALKGTSKRQKANSEIAANWLIAHGYPLERGGYLPGRGFSDEEEES